VLERNSNVKLATNSRAGFSPEILDQPPPANMEAEKAVLGSILLDLDKRQVVGGILQPGDFHDHRHRLLYEHLTNFPGQDGQVDAVLLRDWIRADLENIGGVAYLAEIVQSVPYAVHAEYYAGLVRKAAVRRKIINESLDLVRRAYGDADQTELADRINALTAQSVQVIEPPPFTKLYTSKQLLSLDLKPRFLVHGIVAQGQPMVLGGRSKTLKTTIALDLAISLGSGKPFLNNFQAEQVAVGVWSGESGAATIRETALRVAESKSMFLDDCRVLWSFELPKLSQKDHIDALVHTIAKNKIEVAILDPLYLCLLTQESAGQASNLYYMGSLLAPLSAAIQATGCTLVLLHHFRKATGSEDEPASLVELAQSGVSEWARQWLLLARRSPYNGDGRHELWMRTGGSAGHGGLHCLEIDEGMLDCTNFGGRTWNVAVRPAGNVFAEQKAVKQREKLQAVEQLDQEKIEHILDALSNCPDGDTERKLRINARVGQDTFARLIETLVRDGIVAKTQIVKNGKSYEGYKLLNDENDEAKEADWTTERDELSSTCPVGGSGLNGPY
jgi:hypothetical protein